MRKLSDTQKRALRKAARNNGVVDTLSIQGNTGNSLWNMGLFFMHNTGDLYEGTTVTYELTEVGWARARKLVEEYR